MSKSVIDCKKHVGSRPDKFFKATLVQGEHIMVGLNCLEPGQVQPVHDHTGQDKFYFVIEGSGLFTVGEAVTEVGPEQVVWAPAGVPHGVENRSSERLTLLVGISPPPAGK